MKDIDIYDFDKTIVPFDSGSLFIGYCLIHYPWIIVYVPVLIIFAILMVCKIISFTQFKRVCFMFVPMIPLNRAVKGFWDRHESEVHSWFLKRDKSREIVVISASPDFLLDDIKSRLEIKNLICTVHNKKTGAIIGENCRGEEKINRLYKEFDRDEINVVDVYSDSLKHDKYIFSLSNGQCYHIVKGEKIPFNYSDKFHD